MSKESSLRALIREDIVRYTGSPKLSFKEILKSCYYEEALLFGIMFRVCQSILKIRNPLVRVVLKLIFVWILYRCWSVLLGIYVDLRAKIGKGFYIGHYGGIFIGPVEIGDYCNISHQVTIGEGRLGTNWQGRPVIGERVYFGPGAKVFGKIRIGNNVSIGANAVVSKDIPDNAVVVGNPGRIVGYQDKNVSVHNVFE